MTIRTRQRTLRNGAAKNVLAGTRLGDILRDAMTREKRQQLRSAIIGWVGGVLIGLMFSLMIVGPEVLSALSLWVVALFGAMSAISYLAGRLLGRLFFGSGRAARAPGAGRSSPSQH